jgi:hypothetical protein
MKPAVISALEVLVHSGRDLRTRWHLPWSETLQQAVFRLRLWDAPDGGPCLVAVMGGASSGKSTLFNNLLEGHLASRITARGHATRGPVLAVHEDHRDLLRRLLEEHRMLPGLRRVVVEIDDNVSGDPDAVAVFHHAIPRLRDVLLFDMPDLTSQAAATEGEVALTLLPWFDWILVVVDHERWFDRQTISELRASSVRFGQDRLVIFNRTREGDLAREDEAALRGQAERLAARKMVVLGFRQGRGFCQFAPGTLDEVTDTLNTARPEREPVLLRQIGLTAGQVLNQNAQRRDHLGRLRDSLHAMVARSLPDARDCMTALMTPQERKQLEVLSRIFRVHETRDWLTTQTQRVQQALKGVPLMGWLVRRPVRASSPVPADADRRTVTRGFYESVARRYAHEVQHVVRASEFWHEMERWTGQQAGEQTFAWTAAAEQAVDAIVADFDTALAGWTEKIESECRGVSPNIHGALGAGVIALAVVLVAVPGPVTALTLLSVKGAVGAALTELLAATGAGALLGKHVKHLSSVIQEKLIGSPEFEAVQAVAASLRAALQEAGQARVAATTAEAAAWVLPPEDPLSTALEILRSEAEAQDA